MLTKLINAAAQDIKRAFLWVLCKYFLDVIAQGFYCLEIKLRKSIPISHI